LITPVGTEKIGKFEYTVNLNDSPTVITAFNDLPIKTVNGTVIYMRDVAKVHDGSPPQTNVVHVDGKSGAGRALIEGIVALGRRHGWRRVYWHTHEDNHRARTLYDRLAPRTDYVRYDIDL
jgi:RimJ/RimL family protein N-acetyltransferase